VKLLVDTQLVLWAVTEPERAPETATALLADPATTVVFSVVSIWEIAIKTSLGRADFTADPGEVRSGLIATGWDELPIFAPHAVAVVGLPALHKDPFDRLLAAQALSEGLTLLTTDRRLAAYPGPIRLV
jgi:PIN domain nuclease of toxin-antitoxin system